MYWVVLLYIIGIVAFNLFGKLDSVYWTTQYYFQVHGLIAILAFKLRTLAVRKGERKVYFILGVFSSFFALFNVVALTSKTIYDFLSLIDSYLWSIISAVIALILLISYFYDKATGSH